MPRERQRRGVVLRDSAKPMSCGLESRDVVCVCVCAFANNLMFIFFLTLPYFNVLSQLCVFHFYCTDMLNKEFVYLRIDNRPI
jgi:hypothetical protein